MYLHDHFKEVNTSYLVAISGIMIIFLRNGPVCISKATRIKQMKDNISQNCY